MEVLFKTDEVIKNLMDNKGYSNSEAYAYAFGWAWVMLSETERAKLLALSAIEKENH